MTLPTKPRIGIILGDIAGVGPELAAKLLSDSSVFDRAKIVLFADRRHWEAGVRVSGSDPRKPVIVSGLDALSASEEGFLLVDMPDIDPETVEFGKVDPRAGKSVLDAIDVTIEAIKRGLLDGFLFAPLNKEGMHKAGSPYSSELVLFKENFPGNQALEEINILDESWTMRVTSHVAIKDVPAMITPEGVYKAVKFLHTAMTDYGVANPAIAVAALNPHGGEHGLFGDEEQTKILPGIEMARKEGFEVSGPFPSDTIFIKFRDGIYDGVISMYHDQGQIATKLMGFHRGVTYHAGFPVPITTPAHGTAFDIAGKGIADPGATRHAFNVACKIAEYRLVRKN